MKKHKKTLPLEVTNLYKSHGILDAAAEILGQAEATPVSERKIITPLHPEGIVANIRQYAEAMFVSANRDYLDYIDFSTAKYILSVLHWSRYKEIYSFSREMVELLADGSMTIPIEALHLLPFPCLYVQMEGRENDGFIADSYDGDNGKVLRLTFLKDDGTDTLYRFFEFDLSKNDTIDEALRWQTKQTKDSLARMGQEDSIIEDYSVDEVSVAFSLLLYLCCQNAEIKESSETASLHKNGRTKEEIASDSFRSVRKWTAGEEITRKIKVLSKKKPQAVKEYYQQKASSSKRPHIRAAHYHHYWTGKRDGSEERKLIVKWLQPTFINGDSEDLTVKTTKFE